MRAQKVLLDKLVLPRIKKSITEQIQIARRKLVEFKRSKEVVPYTGIQEAAF